MIEYPNNINLMKEGELFCKIIDLSKYFNNETISYLASLLFLDKSIFERKDFSDNFSELPIFFEFAKYNIYNRSISELSSLPGMTREDFNTNILDNIIRIYYRNIFSVFEFSVSDKSCPLVTIFNINLSLDDRIENIKNQIRNLEDYQDNNYYIKDYDETHRAMYQSMFGNYSAKKISIYKPRIEELNQKIQFLKQYGDLQKRICNLATDKLLENWGITFEKDQYIKSLSWIDIYKKNI